MLHIAEYIFADGYFSEICRIERSNYAEAILAINILDLCLIGKK